MGGKLPRSSEARKALIQEMEDALADIQKKAVFFSTEERERVLGVYQRGIETLRRSASGSDLRPIGRLPRDPGPQAE